MLNPEITIPIARPDVPDFRDLREGFERVLSSGTLTLGAETRLLEARAAAKLGVPECVAVSSCTSGLMLVERCLGLYGEVITPSLTFFATAHGLLWNGLKPVFADCDPRGFQISPTSVERCLSSRTSAILAVHLYGAPAPAAELERIATSRGLRLIFDGAHALGAAAAGERSLASYGDATVYSLSPTKTVTAGEGGLIALRDRALAELLRRARNYGKGVGYECDVLGLNARLSELQAVLAERGLERLEHRLAARRAVAKAYSDVLRGVPGLRLQALRPGELSGVKDFAVVFASEALREQAAAELAARGVETRTYFDPPLHRQKIYRRFYRPRREPLSETERISRGVLCLPIYAGLAPETAKRIAEHVAQSVRCESVLGAVG